MTGTALGLTTREPSTHIGNADLRRSMRRRVILAAKIGPAMSVYAEFFPTRRRSTLIAVTGSPLAPAL